MKNILALIILMALWVVFIPVKILASLVFWGKCIYTCWREDRLSDVLDVFMLHWRCRWNSMCNIMDNDFWVDKEKEI